jgi:hypothetical protein
VVSVCVGGGEGIVDWIVAVVEGEDGRVIVGSGSFESIENEIGGVL